MQCYYGASAHSYLTAADLIEYWLSGADSLFKMFILLCCCFRESMFNRIAAFLNVSLCCVFALFRRSCITITRCISRHNILHGWSTHGICYKCLLVCLNKLLFFVVWQKLISHMSTPSSVYLLKYNTVTKQQISSAIYSV